MRAAVITICLTALIAGLVRAGTDEFAELVRRKGPAVREVLDRPTLYRVAELPGLTCSGRAFEFFLDRPRLAIATARLVDPGLDAYHVELMRDGSLHVADGGKLSGGMELISDGGRRTYYLTGSWKFMPGIRFSGRMVLAPEYRERGLGGNAAVDARTRGYIKVDTFLVGQLAKVIAYIFPGKVDARIKRFAGAVRKVTEAVHDDPAGVYRRLAGQKDVPPEELQEYRLMFMGGSRP